MTTNTLLCLLFVFLLIIAGPSPTLAADEDTFLEITSSGNIFGAGQDFIIEEDSPGDLVLAGSGLTINGAVEEDVIVAGGTVIINGDVKGDVLAAGGTVRVNGNVGGDLVVMGGDILVSKNSRIGGDALLSAGDVTLNGVIEGNGKVTAGTLRTGENFELEGNLELTAENVPANLESKVGGILTYREQTGGEWEGFGESRGFGFASFIIGLLASLALGLVLIYFFPGFIGNLAGTVRASALKAGLLGLVLLFFLPIATLILLITFFGWSLSVLLIFVTGLFLLISTVPVKLLAGELLYRKIFNKEAGRLLYYLTGALLFAVLYEIPFLGGLIRFVALLLGFGALWLWIFSYFKAGGTEAA